MSCPYCGVPTTDIPAHALDRHGITAKQRDEHLRAVEGFDWTEIRDGLLIPGSSDEPPGQYL